MLKYNDLKCSQYIFQQRTRVMSQNALLQNLLQFYRDHESTTNVKKLSSLNKSLPATRPTSRN